MISTFQTQKTLRLLEILQRAASPELIQLLYQISITSKRDIGIAPSPREGFSMAMLRMFAFTSSAILPKNQAESGKVKSKKADRSEYQKKYRNRKYQSPRYLILNKAIKK